MRSLRRIDHYTHIVSYFRDYTVQRDTIKRKRGARYTHSVRNIKVLDTIDPSNIKV